MIRTVLILAVCCLFIFTGSKQLPVEFTEENPFLTKWKTPFETPPFGKINEEHYIPAYKEGIKRHEEEIKKIVENPGTPTFKNTIEELEKSGELLSTVSGVFNNLNSAVTNDRMQEIARETAPMVTKHFGNILLNEELFKKVKAVYNRRNNLNLTEEQMAVLDRYYKNFVRGGANLNEKDKNRLRKIDEELSVLSLQFGENVLKETNKFKLVIDKKEDLAGLPSSAVQAAAEAAKEAGKNGKWVITLHKPSWIPFLQYSEKRSLREKVYRAWMNIGDNNDELDNKKILAKIAALRAERAKLLGYKTHAHFILERNMAKVPENVYDLLNKLWRPALKKAKEEARDMQQMINREGGNFKLQSWDWWYYSEKVKKEKYDLDENEVRPYFKVENVIDGVFTLANRLFGLNFVERHDIQKYHPDVRVFEVKDEDGKHLGVLYTDYFPRASKRGGAWMNNFREQSNIGGREVRPIIYNCGNFSKPTADKPSLISLDEVLTLFHEFGHGLHGMLANTHYPMLSGTNVPRDFVELPAQIMEHWALHPDFVKLYAKHYQTGEPIPQILIDKIEKSGHFNQGFVTVEYLAASFLDMDYHTLTGPKEVDVLAFEKKSMDKIGLIPEIIPRYRSTYFRHVFSGGYSSGYYSYIWAEVLDCDAFEKFKENGILDRKTALSYRKNILEKGGTMDAMTMYKNFRGAEPSIDALLAKRGLK